MEYSKINSQIRLCAWETPTGHRRPYLCSHHEYCCALGCCVSSTFSFYQLWYFWLLLLLLILLCSGGGWWYRFRHGGWSHQGTPVPGRGRRHARRHGGHGGNPGQRVYPNYNYDYTLPPGYDKDPPSYNEVISHLSQFPRIEDMRQQGSTPGSSTSAEGGAPGVSSTNEPPAAVSTSTTPSSGDPSAPAAVLEGTTDCDMSLPPPPSYEMVLDLKRRDMAIQQNLEEREVDTNNMRDRIRTLLGRVRAGRPTTEPSPSQAYGPETSSESSLSSGLFTISGESVASPSYHQLPPPHVPPSIGGLVPPPSNSETSSHSDYSSSFLSSPSSGSRSFQSSPSQTPTEPTASHPSTSSDLPPPEAVGASRPCTGRSTLSRPTTSISTRTLPPPPQLARKTSLPGTVLEAEDDRADR